MGVRSRDMELEIWDFFPEEIDGWRISEDRVYDPDTIFQYLNGSGEVYRAYNFKKLFARHFAKEGQPRIIADLFDMGTDKDAYGIFSHGYEGYAIGIGQGSNYLGGLLSFWKDRFFISLFAGEETDEARKTIFKLAHDLDSAIKKEGQVPEIVSVLPLEGLDREKIRYFHNHIILNHHFFVADENILRLNQQTECVLGVYHEQEDEYCLLLICYPKQELAAKALESFTSVYMPDAAEPGLVQTEDGNWTAARQDEDLLSIIFGVLSKAHALKILKGVAS